MVKPFFPVPENFDNPDVSEITDLFEILCSLEVGVFFGQNHFKFLLSVDGVVSQFGFHKFFSTIIKSLTCTWRLDFRSTIFP